MVGQVRQGSLDWFAVQPKRQLVCWMWRRPAEKNIVQKHTQFASYTLMRQKVKLNVQVM